jgi:sec-independent protein translocase protein TatC
MLRREPKPSPESMTLAGHLVELRQRVIVAVLAISVMALVGWFLYPQILNLLKRPYCLAYPNHCDLYVTAPLDGLALRFKIAGFSGLVLASPVVLWELWRFITPGLKPTEKRYAIPFIVSSIVLFLAGAALAYFSFEHALIFLKDIGGPSLITIYNPNQYLSLIILVMVLFGVTFEFPVLLVALEFARVVTSRQLLGWWRWAVIAIAVVAAVFTPSGDPISMLVMMVPLVFFYFAAIAIGRIAGR